MSTNSCVLESNLRRSNLKSHLIAIRRFGAYGLGIAKRNSSRKWSVGCEEFSSLFELLSINRLFVQN